MVVTAGAKQKPGQSRMDLAAANTAICRRLVPEQWNTMSVDSTGATHQPTNAKCPTRPPARVVLGPEGHLGRANLPYS